MLLRQTATTYEKAIPLVILSETTAIVGTSTGTYEVEVLTTEPLIVTPIKMVPSLVDLTMMELPTPYTINSDEELAIFAKETQEEKPMDLEGRKFFLTLTNPTVETQSNYHVYTLEMLGDAIEITVSVATGNVIKLTKANRVQEMYFANIDRVTHSREDVPMVFPLELHGSNINEFPLRIIQCLIKVMAAAQANDLDSVRKGF